MDFRAEIPVSAPRQVIFAAYQNTASWPVWDNEVRGVDLPQGIVAGSKGTLTPRQGPKANITVTSVTPDHGFIVESALPLCRMSFGHELLDKGGATLVVHWVRFTGPFAFVFRRLIGPSIAKNLPGTLQGLKQACE